MSEKVGRNQPCPCGSQRKYKNCCGVAVQIPGTEEGPGGSRYVRRSMHEKEEYLHILMPTRGAVAIETMLAIGAFGWYSQDYGRLGVRRATFTSMARLGVAEAREKLAQGVLRGIEAQPLATHWVLWVDDDAIPSFTDVAGLLNELRRNADIGIISCYYSPKQKGHPGWVPAWDGHPNALLVPGVDFQPDNIVEVPWVGLHCAIMRGELFLKMSEPRFPCDFATGTGEDTGFSAKLRAETGYKCAVHAGVIVPHVDAETGERFVPDVGAKRLVAATH